MVIIILLLQRCRDGWQIVLRSKNVFGPYERKVVIARKYRCQRPTSGAWVDTPLGEDWFIFQDAGAVGRIVHCNPWSGKTAVIRIDRITRVGRRWHLSCSRVWWKPSIVTPQSDQFNSGMLGCNSNGMPILDWWHLDAVPGRLRCIPFPYLLIMSVFGIFPTVAENPSNGFTATNR